MIFVSIGTQDKPFLRLIEAIDGLKKNGLIEDEVIVQNGTTNYSSSSIKLIPFMDMQQFNETLSQADLFITHGGVGNIMNALHLHKKVIAVPRLGDLGEHENNHQTQIVDTFSQQGHVLACNDPKTDLLKVIEQSKTFQPKPWVTNKQALLDDIKKELGL